ncbi:MAG: GNAT family N-acetyltransferase [Betaproteobacteria bacterium]|nr:GNAT family N-acetyltransferase [Betaproteobacteria bacterium]
MKPEDIAILPTAEIHFAGLHRALDIVAREGRYLAFTQAPPWDASIEFYRDVLAHDRVQCVAVVKASQAVLGCADILPMLGEARAHVGRLGIWLLPEARGQGLGARLLDSAINKARVKGFTRVELTVRVDNLNAKALYERFGFVVEGLQRRSTRVNGEYSDAWAMALLLD